MQKKLSNQLIDMKQAYEVVVIGSGYGGSISALRLAESGKQVCLLERGQEWLTGDFPDTLEGVAEDLRTKNNPAGLFDYKRGKEMDVLVGNGLGGTSLINANVVIEPNASVFTNSRWPKQIREEAENGTLAKLGETCVKMLGANDSGPPKGWPRKVEALKKGAAHSKAAFAPVKVAVNWNKLKDDVNDSGVTQHPCTLCGDCVTGCNIGAKNTLMMNYLPRAKQAGAEIYTGIEVLAVQPAAGDVGYFIWYRAHGYHDDLPRVLFAAMVVISAGALGSTGILLRSSQQGLTLSSRLGAFFSGNGDQLSIGYNSDQQTDVLGFGDHQDERYKLRVGPTILSSAKFNKEGLFVEEGAIPRAAVNALRGIGEILDLLGGKDTDSGFADKARELGRAARDLWGYDVKGAANHSMLYLGMGDDEANGRIILDEDGQPIVSWKAAPKLPVFKQLSEKMYKMVEGIGGTYIKNPRWSKVARGNLITVHPLGGCPMGEDATRGVVNQYGEVFRGTQGNAVYQNLFVVDGAILPTALGVNPLWTISTLAERSAQHMRERALSIPNVLPTPNMLQTPPVGLHFSETMEGFVGIPPTTQKIPKKFEDAYLKGKLKNSGLKFDITMQLDDLSEFIENKTHKAKVFGFVDSAQLGNNCPIDEGSFNLFIDDDITKSRRMEYRLRFIGKDGWPYFLFGYKEIKDDRGPDLWADNTRLFVTIHKGDSEKNPIIAQGMLTIGIAGFLRLLGGIEITNSPNASAKARALARFGRFFLGRLWDSYIAQQ